LNDKPRGSAGLTLSGGGTLVLSGANTYTGTTNVLAGAVILASTASVLNNATVAPGATLQVNALANRLHEIFADTAERVLFLKADPKLPFQSVAEIIDILRSDMRDKPLDINRLFLPNVTRVTE